MVKQLDLRLTHYIEVAPSLQERRALVLEGFRIHGASTCEEMAAALGWEVTSVRPRVTELYQGGFLFRTGERRAKQYVFTAEGKK